MLARQPVRAVAGAHLRRDEVLLLLFLLLADGVEVVGREDAEVAVVRVPDVGVG